MDRCFSTIAIKSLDEEQRLIRGVASTPEPDRVGDIVEPLGLRFKNPVSLLWQHQYGSPVGTCIFDRPTKAGITFTATLPRVAEPGTFKDQVDHAWAAVRHGACRAVSIGFTPLEREALNGGGWRFKKAELVELSLVSVPANSGATITEIKAIDAAVRRGETIAAGLPALWGQVAERGQKAMEDTHAEWLAMTPAQRKEAYGGIGVETLYLQSTSFEMLKVICGRIEATERRLDEQGRAYKGIYKGGQTYPAGSFVSHGGSMWHADTATDFKPGEGGGWTLAVKRGADAK